MSTKMKSLFIIPVIVIFAGCGNSEVEDYGKQIVGVWEEVAKGFITFDSNSGEILYEGPREEYKIGDQERVFIFDEGGSYLEFPDIFGSWLLYERESYSEYPDEVKSWLLYADGLLHLRPSRSIYVKRSYYIRFRNSNEMYLLYDEMCDGESPLISYDYYKFQRVKQ